MRTSVKTRRRRCVDKKDDDTKVCANEHGRPKVACERLEEFGLYNEELTQFRAETVAWLEANCPQSQRQPIVRDQQIWGGRRRVFPSAEAQQWFEACRDKGYTAPEWPSEYGGGGLSSAQAKVLQQEMARMRCRPPLYCQGLWMLGPALLVYGNEAQKREHLSAICRGEIRWAQGYSEPSAGSDLANLKTKAEDCGDHFLVNGTKIWTTKADEADWIFCLVRTSDTTPKQAGISFLLIDMETEGVSTSPIPLISGESEFCQTFFDSVKVPKANLVGELNGGWAVAKELLKHERKMMAAFEGMLEKPAMELLELQGEGAESRNLYYAQLSFLSHIGSHNTDWPLVLLQTFVSSSLGGSILILVHLTGQLALRQAQPNQDYVFSKRASADANGCADLPVHYYT